MMNSKAAADHTRKLAQRLAAMCSHEQPCIDVYLTREMVCLVRGLQGEPWFAALAARLYNQGYSVVFKTEPE